MSDDKCCVKKPEIHPDHLGQHVLNNLNENTDAIMQVDAQTGMEETRRSVRTRSIRFARHMTKLGLKRNDIVTMCCYNNNDTSLPMIAGFYIGVAVNGIDMKMSPLEYAHIIKITQPKMIFCELSKAEMFLEVTKISGCDPPIVVFSDTDDKRFIPISDFYKDSSRDDEEFQVYNFDPKTTLAYVLCSSGSTGLPKGVCHTHSRAILHVRGLKTMFDGYVMLQFSSLYWLSGLAMTLLNLTISTVKINALPFTPQLFFEYVPKFKPNLCMVTPSVVRMLINHPDIESADLSSMKLFMVAGATVDFDELSRMTKYITHGQVVNSYGMAEIGGPVTYTLKNVDIVRGSCGKIIPYYEKKIVDVETGKELTKPNQVGELYLRAPCMMSEYLGNVEATEEAIDKEGWLLTGDLVKIDEHGHLFIVDRLKEILKVMGYSVAPATLEGVINSVPGVSESGVIGIDDKDYGHAPMAFVKRTEGSTVTAQEIKDAIKENLAPFNELRGGVVFVDEFQLTPSGKLKRNVLKKLIPTSRIE